MGGLYDLRYLADEAKNQAQTVEGGLILHTPLEGRALSLAAIDGGKGANWETNTQGLYMHHKNRETRNYRTRIAADTEEDLPQVAHLIADQGLDTVLVTMYVLNVLSPNLDPTDNTQAWIDTAVAAQACGLLTREGSEAKEAARLKVTRALLFGELARVTGKRTYRDPTVAKARSEASYVDSSIWALSDVEWTNRPGEEVDGELMGLPSDCMGGEKGLQRGGQGGRLLPINPITAPRKVFVSLSARWKEQLIDPEWREYALGLRGLASIPAGKPSGQIARAVGFGFMTEARIQAQKAGKDVSLCLDGKEPCNMIARPRRWWLETFGIDTAVYRKHPARLVKYWAEALELLATEEEHGGAELIARRGEVVKARQLASEWTPAQGKAEAWLQEPVRFTPGGTFAAHLASSQTPGLYVSLGIIRRLVNEKGRPRKPRAAPVKVLAGPLLSGVVGKG